MLLVAAVAAGSYWFQPWRLLTDRDVQDALPSVSTPVTAPESSRPAIAPDGSRPPPAPAAGEVLAAGDFVAQEHRTSGRAELVRLADGRRQLLLRELSTSDGPDLRVWLTDRAVDPGRDGWQVFDDGRWVELARLKGNRGNQVYDIPAAVDLDGMRSVSVWCRRFSVSFGAAPLHSA